MKITKSQLKRIIREEYSRLKRQGLIRESGVVTGGSPYADHRGYDDWEYEQAQQADMMTIDHVTDMVEDNGEALVDAALAQSWMDQNEKYYPGVEIQTGFIDNMSMIIWKKWRR